MSKECINCGCKVYDGFCVNCNEEKFILDQYEELDMDTSNLSPEFMKKATNRLKSNQ